MNSVTSSNPLRYSVIIVTYNSQENIKTCLDSLRRNRSEDTDATRVEAGRMSPDLEIIVVDNNSRDTTPQYLTAQTDIRVIQNTINNGFSKACNQGAAIAKGEFVIFLNPDTLVTPEWANRMAQYFQDPTVGAVGPVSNYVAGLQQLEPNLPPQWKNATQFPGHGASEIANGVGKILIEANSGKGILTKLLIGFCLMMRSSLFQSMGGMDENLFLGNDDLDLSWRLRQDHLKLVVASDVFVFHEGQKSFKTEAKSYVDQLTQESTDALYLKLTQFYGGPQKIPSPIELWGIGWFKPSESLVKKLTEKSWNTEAKMEAVSQLKSTWQEISVVIYLGPDRIKNTTQSPLALLESSLNNLPNDPAPDVLILNCSGQTVATELPPDSHIRKLDLGSNCSPKQALEIALNILHGTHALFCVAGVEFSTLFNHWLDKRDLTKMSSAVPLPLRFLAEESNQNPTAMSSTAHNHNSSLTSGIAFLSNKSWLKNILVSSPEKSDVHDFLSFMGEKVQLSKNEVLNTDTKNKPSDPPWLLVKNQSLPQSKTEPRRPSLADISGESWTPVKPNSGLDKIELYPESLRPALSEADEVGFAGTAAEIPPLNGPLKVFNTEGNLVPLVNQDLIVLRVTPDLIEGLENRIRNIKRQAVNLKKLIVIFNGNLALGLKPTPQNPLTPIDLKPEGIRAALLLAGFSVKQIKPYYGIVDLGGDSSPRKDWSQVEAFPRTEKYTLQKKVSIVILGFNQVEYTRKCIDSILKYTQQKYELILVNNGSKDGTEHYFNSIPNAIVVNNSENLGVAKGWNQGMRLAKGEYILILNNDIIVGPNWLENMVRLAETDANIGLVGPRSNYIAGPQIVPNIPYTSETEIQSFIQKWQGEHELSAAEFGFIKGFCHLIPKKVFETVGFYDERYGKGNFEDDDYCLRVHYHGFKSLMANDSFIHHYGSVSFNQESNDWKTLMVENQKKYLEKWAKGSAAIHDTLLHSVVSPRKNYSTSPLMEEGKEAYAKGEVPKARSLFLKAQSEDPKNPEVYCNLGVVQFHLSSYQDAATLFLKCLEIEPMHEDAAQNLLEVIECNNGALTRDDILILVEQFPSNEVLKNAMENITTPKMDPIAAPKSLPEWKREVESYIEKAEYEKAFIILEVKLKGNVELGSCYNYLGIIAHACGDKSLSLQHFSTAAKHSPQDADIVFNLSDAILSMGKIDEAIQVLHDSEAKAGDAFALDRTDFGASAEQLLHAKLNGKIVFENLMASRESNQKGESLLRSGQYPEAKAMFVSAIAKDPNDFRAYNNLGLTAWYENQGEQAWKNFVACLSIRPTWTDALINAFDSALRLNCIEEMNPLIKKALSIHPNHVEAESMRNYIATDGPAIYSGINFEALQKGSQLLKQAESCMKNDKKSQAIELYLEAIKQRPHNPQALNGLGIIAFDQKRLADAYGLFETAVALNPLDQDCLLNLWQCAQALRREGDVLPTLRNSIEKDPALEDVKAAIKAYA